MGWLIAWLVVGREDDGCLNDQLMGWLLGYLVGWMLGLILVGLVCFLVDYFVG